MPEYQPGDTLFGIFRIEKLLGVGTYGRVYLVKNLKLKDSRALKIFRSDDPGIGSSDIQNCRDRFLLEAVLAARRSDYLVQVYSEQEDEHTLAVEMEYASGGSLKDRLKDFKDNQKLMPVDECLAITIDIARGLKTLHERDIVHRDLKPGNILIDEFGRAKISDLGLAQTDLSVDRLIAGSGAKDHPGTPAYMSPEHVNPQKFPHLPPASDVYALGCILFEMLAGVVYKNQRPGTPVTQFRQDIPDWLGLVLAKMLEKEPEKRLWNGSEVLEEIQKGSDAQKNEAEKERLEKEAEEKARQEAKRFEIESLQAIKERQRLEAERKAAAEKANREEAYRLEAKRQADEVARQQQIRQEEEQRRQRGGQSSLGWKLVFGSVLVLAALSAVGLGGTWLLSRIQLPAFNTGSPVIKIASQSPLSGGQSSVGVDIKNGAELGLTQLNDPLKQMGFTVQLAPYDDQADPDKGVTNAKQIVTDPAVLCVVDHYNSGVQIPASEVYHSSELANVSPGTTNPKVTDRGYVEINRVLGRDDMQGAAGAQFAGSKGVKSVYILYDISTYGQNIATSFQGEAQKLGMKVLGFKSTGETSSFDAILTPILSANPDAVYFGGFYDQIAVFIKQARQKGYQGMFLSDDGFDSPEAAKIAGTALTDGGGTYYSVIAGPASYYPGTSNFQADFKAAYNHAPLPFAAQGYDSMAVCLKGIEAAASANGGKLPGRAQVAAAIRSLKDFHGITGTINFNAKGDLVKAEYFIIQVVSTNPDQWAENSLAKTFEIAPPGH